MGLATAKYIRPIPIPAANGVAGHIGEIRFRIVWPKPQLARRSETKCQDDHQKYSHGGDIEPVERIARPALRRSKCGVGPTRHEHSGGQQSATTAEAPQKTRGFIRLLSFPAHLTHAGTIATSTPGKPLRSISTLILIDGGGVSMKRADNERAGTP